MLFKILLGLLAAIIFIEKPATAASISCTKTACLFSSVGPNKLTEPGNIYLIGSMASGKTTIGVLLAQKLNLKFIDSDHEIENRYGITIKEIFVKYGEKEFREIEEKVIEDLAKLQNIVLSTGAGAILSQKSRQRLSANGIVIYLYITTDTQMARLKDCTNRPLLGCDPAKFREVLENVAKIRNPLYEEIADLTIRNDYLSVANTLEKIIIYLNL